MRSRLIAKPFILALLLSALVLSLSTYVIAIHTQRSPGRDNACKIWQLTLVDSVKLAEQAVNVKFKVFEDDNCKYAVVTTISSSQPKIFIVKIDKSLQELTVIHNESFESPPPLIVSAEERQTYSLFIDADPNSNSIAWITGGETPKLYFLVMNDEGTCVKTSTTLSYAQGRADPVSVKIVSFEDDEDSEIYVLVGDRYGYLACYKATVITGGYRRAITITERSGHTLTSYQVKIVLTPDNFDYSKVYDQEKATDIVFTDSDGATRLPHWIERWDPEGTSIIWVKVPEIPANSEKTIYMYYGNPEVEGQSNSKEVFIFFDDFNGKKLDSGTWRVARFGASSHRVSIIESQEFHEGKGLKIYAKYRAIPFTLLHIYTVQTFNVPSSPPAYMVEARISPRAEAANDAELDLYKSNINPRLHPIFADGAYIHASYDDGKVWTWSFMNLADKWDQTAWDNGQNKPYHSNSWYIVGLSYYPSQGTIYYVWNDGNYDEPLASKVYSQHLYNNFRVLLGNSKDFSSEKLTAETWVDWVRIREYVKPEPLVSIGEETLIAS